MDDARRFEEVEVDCLRTLHEAALALGHASRLARIGAGGAWAFEREPAIALAAGLGLSDDPVAELDLAEGFFEAADVPGRVDVANVAHPGLTAELALRGYTARRTNALMSGQLDALAVPAFAHSVEPIDPDEWCAVTATGFPSSSPLLHRMLAHQRDVVRVGVRLDGRLVAAALLSRRFDWALCSAACVLEGWRGRGIHGALFRARVEIAREWGVANVAYTCLPGSVSERNARRWGLAAIGQRTLYVR